MKCKTLNPLNSETMYTEKEWSEEPEPRTSYESHPLDSGFYEDFRFL